MVEYGLAGIASMLCVGAVDFDKERKPGETSAIRIALERVSNWPECDTQFRRYPEVLSPLVAERVRAHYYHVGERKYLVRLPCRQSAYNQDEVYVLVEPRAQPPARVLVFPDFSFAGCDGSDSPVRRATTTTPPGRLFDPKSLTLFGLSKCRGMGDCGSWVSYRFSQDGFEMVDYRRKTRCDGKGLRDDYDIRLPPPGWTRVSH
ncbi:MAG: DUF1176 domain-containing protein [Myxococcota bacterium]